MKERRVYQSVHGGGEGRRGEGEGTREEEKGPEGTERVQGRRGGGKHTTRKQRSKISISRRRPRGCKEIDVL